MRERIVGVARLTARPARMVGGRLGRGVRRWTGMWSRLRERILWWEDVVLVHGAG
jgi:hypothetical protein